MSAYVGKLFTSISSALDFNTATLSGAIDIIVIEDDNGKRQCSPFHVRFGKLQLLKSRGIPVIIELNGVRTNLRMLLGAAGEAYFYDPKAVDKPQISTTVGLDDPDKSGEAADHNAGQHDPPLDGSLAETPSPDDVKRDEDALDRIAKSNIQIVLPDLEDDQHLQSGALGENPALSSQLQASVSMVTASEHPFAYISDSEVELTRNERDGTTEVVDEPRSPPLNSSQRKWASVLVQNPSSIHLADSKHIDEAQDVPSDTGDSDDQSSSLFGLPSPPSANEQSRNESASEDAADDLLRDVGSGQQMAQIDVTVSLPTTMSELVGEEDSKLDCRSVDGYEADEDGLQALPKQVEDVLSRPDPFGSNDLQDAEDADSAKQGLVRYLLPLLDQKAEQEKSLSAGLKDGHIPADEGFLSMSLCGGLLAPDMREDHIIELFEQHKVPFAAFAERPVLLNDPALMVRIGNRLVEFKVAAAYVFSVLCYGEKIDVDVLARSLSTCKRDEPPKSPPTPRRFRWFGWSSPSVVGEPLLQEDDLDALDDGSAAPPKENASEEKSEQPVEEAARDQDVASTNATQELDKASSLTGVDGQALQQEEPSEQVVEETHPPNMASGLGDSDVMQAPEISFSELDPEALSLRPSEKELMELDLKPGANTIRFIVESSAVELNCRIFLWSCHNKIVISDVDGTITRSDVLGHLLPAVGRDWSQVGVAGLYSQIERNGYKLLYLTARPIGQASQTRAFLRNVTQGTAKLPNGPVLMSPNRLVESFTREVIRRKPQEFKIRALRDVSSLFPPPYNPFHAGFGNRDTDVISYRAVGLIQQRIFVVNPKGELVVTKAKYESAASYSTLQDLVESVFPDIGGQSGHEKIRALTESATYNDWNYWKDTLPEVDLDSLLSG